MKKIKNKIYHYIHVFFTDVFIEVGLFFILLLYTLLHWTNSFFHIAGIVIALISFYFRMLARKHLGKSFSLKAEAKKLITHGMYSKIKNPIYFFSLLSFIGLFISLEKPWMFLALLPFIYMEIVRASKERKVLYEKFGEEYNIYRKKTRF